VSGLIKPLERNSKGVIMKRIIFFIGLLMLLGACSGGGSSSDATASPNGTANRIMVYDDNGQYLGVLLGVENDQGPPFDPSLLATQVFIPSLGMVATIYRDSGQISPYYFWYDDPNCTGEAYTMNPSENAIHRNEATGLHYVRRRYGAIMSSVDYGSFLGYQGTCNPISAPQILDFYEVEEVQLPFTVPVAMPPRFEYE